MVLLAGGFALLLPALFQARLPAQDAGLANPYTSADDVAAGGRLFRSHCAVCHGETGSGGRAADLASGKFRHGASDADIRRTISDGISGTEMAAAFFEGRQLWQIVAFVRSLSMNPSVAPGRGNMARGRSLFEGKGGCGQCHQIGGRGGRSGPDLSDVSGRRSAEYLRTSILRPGDHVLPRNYRLRANTNSGEKVSGRRLNEDTFSIQLLDDGGNLVSLAKDEIAELTLDKTSAMPSYEQVLSDSEVADLVAYLVTLREERNAQ